MLKSSQFSIVAFGSLAGGSLLINLPRSQFLFRTVGRLPNPDVPYLSDVLVLVGSIYTNTLAGSAVGIALTNFLVLGIMYQSFSYLQITETDSIYTTRTFRLLFTIIAAGAGFGWMLWFGVLDPFLPTLSDALSVVLFFIHFFLGAVAFGALLTRSTDPISQDNPITGLLAGIFNTDPSAFRRSQVTESWAPTWITAPVNTFAAGVVLALIANLLGLVVAISTMAYPLPEILVLCWIFTELIGIHRLPYLGWLENVEIERQIYKRLGTGSTTFYGLVVALGYLVILFHAVGLFAIVGLPIFSDGLETLIASVAATGPVSLLSTFDSTRFYLLFIGFTLAPMVTALHWIAYWILAILRLPAVARTADSDPDGAIEPSYRRLEGLTLPGGILFVWTASYVRIDPYLGPVTVQYLFIFVFVVAFMANAWTIYRAIWADLDPQPIHNEERIIRGAVVVQMATSGIGFAIADLLSPRAVLTFVGGVGIVVGTQYAGKVLVRTSIGNPLSAVFNILLIGVCVAFVPILHWMFPSLSPGPQVLFLALALILAISAIMTRRHT